MSPLLPPHFSLLSCKFPLDFLFADFLREIVCKNAKRSRKAAIPAFRLPSLPSMGASKIIPMPQDSISKLFPTMWQPSAFHVIFGNIPYCASFVNKISERWQKGINEKVPSPLKRGGFFFKRADKANLIALAPQDWCFQQSNGPRTQKSGGRLIFFLQLFTIALSRLLPIYV